MVKKDSESDDYYEGVKKFDCAADKGVVILSLQALFGAGLAGKLAIA